MAIAAPEATPVTVPDKGREQIGCCRESVPHPSSTAAAPMITGFRRPIRSETNPSNGQPMIQPKGTVAERITAVP
jgi:hypothetical protein